MEDFITHCLDLRLEERIELLHDDHFFNLLKKFSDHLSGKRPDHTQFEIGIIWEYLFGVLVGDATCNHPDFRIIDLHDIVFEIIGKGF